MTSRELVIRTLNHESVEHAPRDLWPSPAVETSRADELAEMNIRYPGDIVAPEFKYPVGRTVQAKPQREGQYTDYRPPLEILEPARFAKVNRGCETTSRFVLARTDVRPFERLRALHGDEATVVDLARDVPEIRSLLAMLHDFYCREIELWAGTEVDGVAIGDDWGSPDSLRITPAMWREIFRPLYREYCHILHGKDKFVFFQSSGNISDIFGELVKIGVDAIHTEWATMSLDRLAKRFRGRVTFWGGIDRPQSLLGGTPQEIREAVHRVRRALDFGSGGVIAQCPWEAGVPIRNIAVVFEQWMLPLPMHA